MVISQVLKVDVDAGPPVPGALMSFLFIFISVNAVSAMTPPPFSSLSCSQCKGTAFHFLFRFTLKVSLVMLFDDCLEY